MVTHKLSTAKRHIVDIEVPSVSADVAECYELRFKVPAKPGLDAKVVVGVGNLSNLIRVLGQVRADTNPVGDVNP